MAVMQLDITELSDVSSVLQERGIGLCYSVESDGVYLYGSDSELEEIESIIWAANVVQGLGMPFEADEAGYLAIPCQRFEE